MTMPHIRVRWKFQPVTIDIETRPLRPHADPTTAYFASGEAEVREGIVQQYLESEYGPLAIVLWEKTVSLGTEYELVTVSVDGLEVVSV